MISVCVHEKILNMKLTRTCSIFLPCHTAILRILLFLFLMPRKHEEKNFVNFLWYISKIAKIWKCVKGMSSCCGSRYCGRREKIISHSSVVTQHDNYSIAGGTTHLQDMPPSTTGCSWQSRRSFQRNVHWLPLPDKKVKPPVRSDIVFLLIEVVHRFAPQTI